MWSSFIHFGWVSGGGFDKTIAFALPRFILMFRWSKGFSVACRQAYMVSGNYVYGHSPGQVEPSISLYQHFRFRCFDLKLISSQCFSCLWQHRHYSPCIQRKSGNCTTSESFWCASFIQPPSSIGPELLCTSFSEWDNSLSESKWF